MSGGDYLTTCSLSDQIFVPALIFSEGISYMSHSYYCFYYLVAASLFFSIHYLSAPAFTFGVDEFSFAKLETHVRIDGSLWGHPSVEIFVFTLLTINVPLSLDKLKLRSVWCVSICRLR